MAFRHFVRTALGCSLAGGLCIATVAALETTTNPSPLTFGSARVSIAGTSNVHAYTASTTVVRMTRVQLASGTAGANPWDALLEPGALEAFEIAIPVATLSSPKDGLDKNMHKALKATEHADITFRLVRLERGSVAGSLRAIGTLRVAGVEREVALDLKTQRHDSGLAVNGEVQLLMTDYGITPPKAMLGMLKTDPKVTVTFETKLSVPLS